MRLIGYDWETNGVILDDSWDLRRQIIEHHKGGYVWQEGATKVVNRSSTKLSPL